MASKITTELTPDAPVRLAGSYQLDGNDRRKIDDQILGLQRHAARGALRGQTRTYYTLSASSAALGVGDLFCSASVPAGEADPLTAVRVVTRATSGALGDAGMVLGIAAEVAHPGSVFVGITDGLVGLGITGLQANVPGAVRAIGGRCSWTAVLQAADFPIGFVDSAGNLTISRTRTGGSGESTVAALTVRTVVTSNINLAAWSVSNDGITHVQDDKVLVARQIDATENDVYVVGVVTSGVAPLSRLTGERVVGTTVYVTNGTFGGKQWALKSIGDFEPIKAADDTAIGVHGATHELAFDGAESPTASRPREWVSRDGDFATIAALTSAVVFTMSPVAEGFPNGMTFVQGDVGVEWPTLTAAVNFTRAATFINGAPPVLQGQGPSSAAFSLPTSANADISWSVDSGTNAIRLTVTNNHATAALVVNYACVKGVSNCR